MRIKSRHIWIPAVMMLSVAPARGQYYLVALQMLILNAVGLQIRPSGVKLVEYDFAPFQPDEQKAVKGVDTYQYSHHYDGIAGDKRIENAHYYTSYNKNKGHSISHFMNYVHQLPEGQYEIINGQIKRIR